MAHIIASKKAALTLCLVACVLALGGLASYASFTGAADAQKQTVASGTMTLTIPAAGASNRLTIGASNVAPGDTIERAFTLTSGGTVDGRRSR